MHPLFRRAITRWRPMHWQLLLSMHLYLAPFCSVRVSPGCPIPLYHPAIPCALFLFLFSLPSLLYSMYDVSCAFTPCKVFNFSSFSVLDFILISYTLTAQSTICCTKFITT